MLCRMQSLLHAVFYAHPFLEKCGTNRSLAFTSLSLAEIARECGFRESAYLARVFKQHVGTTPLSYRTAMRKKRMG